MTNVPARRQPAPRKTRRHLGAAFGLACAAAVGVWMWWAGHRGTPSVPAQHAEPSAATEAARQALLRSAELAHKAWITATPPAQRQAQQQAMMDEFQAAEAEMRSQQALAAMARRGASSSPLTSASGTGPPQDRSPAASDALTGSVLRTPQ